MGTQPNGTHAKDVALHFLNATTDEKLTKTLVGKTISQAKTLLSENHSKEDIIRVIDYLVDKGVNMYSFGYVRAVIGDVLKELEQVELTSRGKEEIKKLEDSWLEKRSEVSSDDESTERNRRKAEQLGIQSGFGKKHNFDMFEGQ